MILGDREVDLVQDQGLITIDPRPLQKFLDSTAVDLRLDGTLDRWDFAEPDPDIGEGHRFRPGGPGFNFSRLEAPPVRCCRCPA